VKKKMRCPVCKGTGQVEMDTRYEVRSLREQGLTIRQIGKVLGKGATTIHYHLHKEASDG